MFTCANLVYAVSLGLNNHCLNSESTIHNQVEDFIDIDNYSLVLIGSIHMKMFL